MVAWGPDGANDLGRKGEAMDCKECGSQVNDTCDDCGEPLCIMCRCGACYQKAQLDEDDAASLGILEGVF
jgi:predicted amidophosphoribosyltransferase